MIIGHERVLQYLETIWRKGRVGQAYLFHGPKHVGKTTSALHFAKTLLCENGNRFGGCLLGKNQCGACARMAVYSEPRLIKLEAGSPILSTLLEDKDEISIKEVREVRRRLGHITTAWQVVLILDAERLSRDASNALLKILEEPNDQTIFLFTSSHPGYILPTIASRLVKLRFDLVPEDVLQKVAGINDHLLTLAARRPGILVSAINDSAFLRAQSNYAKLAEAVSRESVGGAIRLSESLSDNDEAREEVTFYLLEKARREWGRMPVSGTMLGRRVGRALAALYESETTNVNRRMASDMICMNLAGISKV